MPCSDNACRRSTTCGAVDHTRTTDDWSPARSAIRVARSSLACSSQAKNTPPMMLVQASKRFSAPFRRPENRILTPNAPMFARGPLVDGCGSHWGEWVSKKAKNRILTPNAPRSARGPLADERGVWGRGAKRRRVVVSRAKYCTLPAVSPPALSAAGDDHAGLYFVPPPLSALRGVLRVASPSTSVVSLAPRVSSRRERSRLAAVSPDMSKRHRRPRS
ncbi:hypothetical protein EV715DRAFT_287978 [Schizophyllum commune]